LQPCLLPCLLDCWSIIILNIRDERKERRGKKEKEIKRIGMYPWNLFAASNANILYYKTQLWTMLKLCLHPKQQQPPLLQCHHNAPLLEEIKERDNCLFCKEQPGHQEPKEPEGKRVGESSSNSSIPL
jgi:hypothetical protein